MNFHINKNRFWRIMVLMVIVVMAGVNIYLILLRNTIFNFIGQEAVRDNSVIDKIREFRARN